ncbi:hypothetical protein OEZ85_009243 [Tetradesmus obliquus]|uniref:Fungal lipase-type domain-containing protein n=1 Tax=Tetradesmus obliquus TaxID=3088 RepID=A0ABY8U8X4_TETOB|nr:hypothetical protein OEZ85_009243 [Tetradesmus obliquus]
MLVRQHASCCRPNSNGCKALATPRPVAAAAARRGLSTITHVARPSSRAGMPKRGTNMPPAVAVDTRLATDQSNGTGASTAAQEGGVNLAHWLVNSPDAAKDDLQSYSQGFMNFWKQQRTDYWKKVATAKQAFEAEQKGSVGAADKHFSQPPLVQLQQAAYADKDFIKEVTKYGEMVQAVYDTLETKDVYSRFFGGCMAGAMVKGSTLGANNGEFINVGEAAAKYTIVKQMQADSGGYKLVIKEGRNYVGFIATGPAHAALPADSSEVDIAVVFRGTITTDEWLQDAKVLQVRWNNGSGIAQSPRVFLRAWPFQPTAGAFTGTLALSLLALWAVQMHTGALPAAVVAVDAWVKSYLSAAAGSAPSFLQGAITSAAAFLQALLGITINADSGPLPFSLALASAAWVVNGFVQARIAHPNHWLRDLRSLVMALGPWLLYGAQVLGDTLVSSFAGLKGDPLVSYGFKQMYADAKDRDNVTEQLPASPRLTILTTLTQQLQMLSSEGKTVRSITVTGHSLGGALASLCAYDLSTTVAAALEAAKDPKESNEYKELQAKPDLYSQTAAQRLELMSALWHIKQQRGPEAVPLVAGITFAAPRVGNAAYANAFKARSLIDPLAVREPLFNKAADDYHSSALSWLGSVFRDRPWLLMKHLWFRAGTQDMKNDAASRAAEQLLQKKTDAAAAPVVGGMLRLVNVA